MQSISTEGSFQDQTSVKRIETLSWRPSTYWYQVSTALWHDTSINVWALQHNTKTSISIIWQIYFDRKLSGYWGKCENWNIKES